METTVLMIRHAESPLLFGKERTRGLSKKGKEDASAITTVLHSFNIDVIVSSPYTRAIQTIQGLADDHKLEIRIIESLREKQLKGAYQLPAEEIDKAIKIISRPRLLFGGWRIEQECPKSSHARNHSSIREICRSNNRHRYTW